MFDCKNNNSAAENFCTHWRFTLLFSESLMTNDDDPEKLAEEWLRKNNPTYQLYAPEDEWLFKRGFVAGVQQCKAKYAPLVEFLRLEVSKLRNEKAECYMPDDNQRSMKYYNERISQIDALLDKLIGEGEKNG